MQFIDIHSGMKGISREQLEEVHRAELEIANEEGVHFIKAWADPESGKVFCLSEADSVERVRRSHERAGHAPDEIYTVPLSVE